MVINRRAIIFNAITVLILIAFSEVTQDAKTEKFEIRPSFSEKWFLLGPYL